MFCSDINPQNAGHPGRVRIEGFRVYQGLGVSWGLTKLELIPQGT